MSADNLSNPCVFVVGCPRSGTTLLQRMLDHHPDLAVAYDTLFIPAVARQFNHPNPTVSDELVERIQSFQRFERLGLPTGTLQRIAPQCRDFAALIGSIYDAFASLHDKPLGGEKSPGYVRHMPLLQSLVPHARFIHLVRDGRNVALSFMDWGRQKGRPKGPARKFQLWEENPAAVSALWWEHKTLRGHRDASKLVPGSYLEVSYERLVAEPEAVLELMTDFLGLPYSERMTKFHEGRTRSDPGLSAKSAWLPVTKGIRDWRRDMSEADQQMFEALAGETLDLFGYERRFRRFTDVVLDQANDYRSRWRQPWPAGQTGR